MTFFEKIMEMAERNGIDPKLYIQPGDKLIIPLEMVAK